MNPPRLVSIRKLALALLLFVMTILLTLVVFNRETFQQQTYSLVERHKFNKGAEHSPIQVYRNREAANQPGESENKSSRRPFQEGGKETTPWSLVSLNRTALGGVTPNSSHVITPAFEKDALQLQLPIDKLLTVCEAQKPMGFSKVKGFRITNNPEACRSFCYTEGRIFAAVYRGECYCGDVPIHTELVDVRSCDYACESKVQSNGTLCTESTKPHSLSMRTRLQDGVQEWTSWMGIKVLGISVRYRKCKLTSSKKCFAEFEKRIEIKRGALDQAKLRASFLGCYSGVWLTLGTQPDWREQIVASKMFKRSAQIFTGCRSWCGTQSPSIYAALGPIIKGSSRNCFCILSLYSAKPTNTCDQGSGYLVFETEQLAETNLSRKNLLNVSEAVKIGHKLRFNFSVTKRINVLIIARYRSGSSMAQSFFSKNLRAFSVFEYGRVKSSDYSSDDATLQALQGLFRCDIAKTPASLYSGKFPKWSSIMLSVRAASRNMQRHINSCTKGLMRDCSAHLHELCQISKLLNVKLIRVENSSAMSDFISRNPDVKVVHLVRDPRGLNSAERLYGKSRTAAQICRDLNNMGSIFHKAAQNGANNVFEVLYENLAMNASFHGEKLYKEMGIDMSAEVRNFLSHDDYEYKNQGEEKMDIPRFAMEVVKDDPESHVYNFLTRTSISDLLKIDNTPECRQVYKTWPIYRPIKAMYQTDKLTVLKYSSSGNKLWIRKHEEQLRTPLLVG